MHRWSHSPVCLPSLANPSELLDRLLRISHGEESWWHNCLVTASVHSKLAEACIGKDLVSVPFGSSVWRNSGSQNGLSYWISVTEVVEFHVAASQFLAPGWRVGQSVNDNVSAPQPRLSDETCWKSLGFSSPSSEHFLRLPILLQLICCWVDGRRSAMIEQQPLLLGKPMKKDVHPPFLILNFQPLDVRCEIIIVYSISSS